MLMDRGFTLVRPLAGGLEAWVEAGYNLSHVPQVSVLQLSDMAKGEAVILDVRGDAEWNSGHINGARHIMGGDLPKRTNELPQDAEIYVVCAAGYRSSIATSVLRRAGFRHVTNVDGGMTAWNRQKLPTVKEEKAVAAR